MREQEQEQPMGLNPNYDPDPSLETVIDRLRKSRDRARRERDEAQSLARTLAVALSKDDETRTTVLRTAQVAALLGEDGNQLTSPHTVKEVHCEICGFQPLIEEPMVKDDLNPYPWGDLLCGKCRLVIATVREVPAPAGARGKLSLNA